MLREYAQKWADRRDFQTLTTALGPLLDPSRPECPHIRKPSAGWAGYIHGASVIFGWYISQGDLVTVLSQPPPQRFHPSGLTYYQTVEEPIIKGRLGNKAVGRIVVIHPTVGGKAEDFQYGMWPHDELSLWTTKFGIPQIVIYWRAVKGEKDQRRMQALKTPIESKTAPKAKATTENTERSQPKTLRKSKKKRKKKKRKNEKGCTGSESIAEHLAPSNGAGKSKLPAVIPATHKKEKAENKKKA
ncbi:hypothetical protein FOQG_17509 [Fusarium oxysporum f. sp. raphani 54005]|uniref:Uncharacterized protein n=1 Tax=Fusarium oxysporum f. sp. raphani 54005 TaxID=1089458 RepID=X0B6P7_FUSOX|nr:hypothetical protein FOQG_17509 [Fusarium oxysporum f. sp. raphani 54005]